MEKENSTLFDTTIFLGVLTFSGYLGTYTYESSYLNYFGVPTYLIEINTASVLSATLILLVLLISLFLVIDSLSTIKPTGTAFSRAIFKCVLFGVIFAILYFYLQIGYIVALAFMLFIYSFLNLIFPPILYWNKKTLEERYMASEEANKIEKVGILSRLMDRDKKLAQLIIFSILYVLVAGNKGYSDAANQKIYNTLNTEPKSIVIRSYEDNLILIHVDNNNVVENSSILKKEEMYEKKLSFTVEEISKINPPKVSCSTEFFFQTINCTSKAHVK